MPRRGSKRVAGLSRNDAKRRRDAVRSRREQETEDERTERLEDLRGRMQNRRNEETQQERTERLEDLQERTQNRRNEETEDESTEGLAEQRARDTTRLNARLARRNRSADVGEMTKVCPQCRAYHFFGVTGNF